MESFLITSEPSHDECTALQKHYNPVYSDSVAEVLVITCLIALYSVFIGYVFCNREDISIKSRSPFLMIINFIFLYLDSTFNTIIAAKRADNMEFICKFSIFTTCFVYSGILLCYYLRIYRVFKFYSLYEQYLK